jgi:hypothetical protein
MQHVALSAWTVGLAPPRVPFLVSIFPFFLRMVLSTKIANAGPTEQNAMLRDAASAEGAGGAVFYPPEYGFFKFQNQLAELDAQDELREGLAQEDKTREFTKRYATSGDYFMWIFLEDVKYTCVRQPPLFFCMQDLRV